ncbi:MAG: type II toxin-antitoxin system RelB/DinJ family antitoxin [Algicola sp.]|nr:type II toxin-antitoxin system RelB/DinJ family antitoxin [Algicola sp.]
MQTIQTRVNEELKTKADALFKDMGLSTTDAVRMFLTQCVNVGGLPFTPTGKKPNAQTLAALNETGGTSYKSVEALSQLWK